MIYEIRQWSEDEACLYTDDWRLKELAIRRPELRSTARYFRTRAAREPFAWDIVGPRTALLPLAGTFRTATWPAVLTR